MQSVPELKQRYDILSDTIARQANDVVRLETQYRELERAFHERLPVDEESAQALVQVEQRKSYLVEMSRVIRETLAEYTRVAQRFSSSSSSNAPPLDERQIKRALKHGSRGLSSQRDFYAYAQHDSPYRENHMSEFVQVYVQSRQEALERLQRSIQELARLMDSVSMLVIEQGNRIQTIDANLAQAERNMHHTTEQLSKFHDTHPTACIVLATLATFLMLVICI